jgi:hypothetical protein
VRPHIPEEELHAFLDAQVSPAQRAEIAEHLLACLICRAQEGEVRLLRERSHALLALAAPRTIHGIPVRVRRVRYRLRTGRVAAIAAAALVMVGGWSFTRTGAGNGEGRPVLATAFVAPAILARVTLPATVSEAVTPATPQASTRTRTLTMASRAAVAPRVIPVHQVAGTGSTRRLRVVDPMLEVAPSGGGEAWETTSFQQAREAAGGAIAHLTGIPVNTVRLQPGSRGGRPTAMVRQLLADGRAVWVVEGAVEELGPVYQLLEASGLSLSTPRRARPDYLGSDEAPIRTVRMVTVAAYLSRDSVEALAGSRLKVD